MTLFVQFVIIAVLTAINAFFAASEMAFVSMRKNRVQQLVRDGVKGADRLQRLMQNPNRFLSTIQVGITLAGFFASASAASNLADDGARLLSYIKIPYPEQLSFVLITVILSYFTLVFGELFPKNVALQHKEAIALNTAGVIEFISWLASPFVSLLAQSTQLLMRLFNIPMDQVEEPITRDSLRKLVNTGRQQGHIDSDEEFLIRRVIDLDEITIKEIMLPRDEVFAVDLEDWSPQIMRQIVAAGYSRVPFYRGELDEIVGVLLLKDLLKASYDSDFGAIDPAVLLRNLDVVAEHRLVDDVLRHFQSQKIHMAMVIDEYGIIKGMVTIEDILEEIVGEIDDEFDQPSYPIVQNDTLYTVKGNVSLHNLNRQLAIDLRSDRNDTLNGYLTEHFSLDQLSEGHRISLQGYQLTIAKRNKRKVLLVEMQPIDVETMVQPSGDLGE